MIDQPVDAAGNAGGADGGAGEHSAAQAVFSAFIRAMRAHQQLMMRKLAEHGSHPGQLFCIRALTEHDGISQRDLAEMLHVARPTITVMVQKMEKAGLVQRRVDETDQRYTRIYLTEAGWAMHDKIHGIFDEIVECGIGPMSPKEQQELGRLLGSLGENLQGALEALPSPGAHDHPDSKQAGHPHGHVLD